MFYTFQRRGGPYAPTGAGLGGLPNIDTDVPICAVFIFLYLLFGIVNIIIFRQNLRKHHKFPISVVLVVFCYARIVTLVLRIAWATRQQNIRLAIAAEILLNAGILIVYIVNLILAQRILRAKQPQIGWNPIIRIVYKLLYVGIGMALVAVITSVVTSLYTLNMHTRSDCRDVELAALTYLIIFTCLPVVHIIAIVILPRSQQEESFGEGSMTSKLIIVTLSTCLCILIAGFKAGVIWSPARSALNPAWFDSKACLYVFGFTMEILVLSLLTFARIDKRFFVPNGCKQAGDYNRLGKQTPVENEEVWPSSSKS